LPKDGSGLLVPLLGQALAGDSLTPAARTPLNVAAGMVEAARLDSAVMTCLSARRTPVMFFRSIGDRGVSRVD
jgi:hypothetical protein